MLILKGFLLLSSLFSITLFLGGWYFIKQKFPGKLRYGFLFLVVLLGLFFWVKDIPRFEKGNCFVVTKKNINPVGEEWHKPTSIQDVEYQVLKVGKTNYLVHSSIPSLEDYPIDRDFLVKASDCKTIFKEK